MEVLTAHLKAQVMNMGCVHVFLMFDTFLVFIYHLTCFMIK